MRSPAPCRRRTLPFFFFFFCGVPWRLRARAAPGRARRRRHPLGRRCAASQRMLLHSTASHLCPLLQCLHVVGGAQRYTGGVLSAMHAPELPAGSNAMQPLSVACALRLAQELHTAALASHLLCM